MHTIIVQSNLFFIPVIQDVAKKKKNLQSYFGAKSLSLNTVINLNTLAPEVTRRQLFCIHL